MSVKIINQAKLLLLLFALGAFASAQAQRVSNSREIGKTLALQPGGGLQLESRHSNIRIHHWDRNQVKFEVKMEASGKDMREVNRLLEAIYFDVSENASGVQAEIWMGPFKSMNSWEDRAEFVLQNGTKISGIYEHKLEVDIYMPSESRLDVEHSFGNLEIKDVHEGEMRLESKHGNISMGNACCPLVIDLQHANLEMGAAKELILEMQHSNASVGSVDELNIELEHSNLNLGSVDELETEANHSQLSIGQISRLRIENNHSSLQIGRLLQSLEASSSHGSIEIKSLQSNFETIEVELNYGNLSIDTGGRADYRLDFEGQYSELKVGEGFRYDHKRDDDHGQHKEIRGHKGSGGGTISIKTQYGNAVVE